MIRIKGNRGKSKAVVELSLGVLFGTPTFHVWEGGKITHTFFAGDPEFLKAMVNAADAGMAERERVRKIREQAFGKPT